MHTVRVCAGILCSTHFDQVIRPVAAFFCIAGQARQKLVGHILPSPILRKLGPGMISVSSRSGRRFSSRYCG